MYSNALDVKRSKAYGIYNLYPANPNAFSFV